MSVVDWVLSAYEHDPSLPCNALIALGPFMSTAKQREFHARADRLPRVRTVTFDTHLEFLMANAAGVVAMGGYNTFCEILSFDKPAILIPRVAPRREQLIRAKRVAQLGLMQMLDIDTRQRSGGDGRGACAASPTSRGPRRGAPATCSRDSRRSTGSPRGTCPSAAAAPARPPLG